MEVKVYYDTTLGIYGLVGVRTVRLPEYVGYTMSVWDYLYIWLKRNVSEIAKPLEWWQE